MTKKIYLSYASDVQDKAEFLKEFLTKNNFDVHSAGNETPESMISEIKNCDMFLLLFSREYDENGMELGFALAHEKFVFVLWTLNEEISPKTLENFNLGKFFDLENIIKWNNYKSQESLRNLVKKLKSFSYSSEKSEKVEKKQKNNLKTIFISYSSNKKEYSRALNDFLENNNFNTWLDIKDIHSGQKFYIEIPKGIKNSDAVICLFCKEADESPNVAVELSLAFANRKEIFPILIDDAEPDKLQYFFMIHQYKKEKWNDKDNFEQIRKTIEDINEILNDNSNVIIPPKAEKVDIPENIEPKIEDYSRKEDQKSKQLLSKFFTFLACIAVILGFYLYATYQPDNQDKFIETVLTSSAEQVKISISKLNPDTKQEQLDAAILEAAFEVDDLDVIKTLIEAGANIHQAEFSAGITLFNEVLMHNPNHDIIKFLFESESKLIQETILNGVLGIRLITLAASYNDKKHQIIKCLIELGINPNIKDNDGKTAFDYAKYDDKFYTDTAIFVLLEMLNPDNTIKSINPPLVEVNYKEIFRLASECTAEQIQIAINAVKDFVNISDDYGATPIHYAARKNKNPGVIEVLIKNGANIHDVDKKYNTPLIYAIRGGNNEILKNLLDLGADKDYPNIAHAVFEATGRGGNFEALKILFNSEDDIKRELLLKGYLRDNNGVSLLQRSLYGGTDCLKFILDAGADVNQRDDEGNTVLMLPYYFQNVFAKKLLLDSGADVNAQNIYGQTALIKAASLLHDGEIEIFLNHKAEIDIQDNNGKTALMYAVESYGEGINEAEIEYIKETNPSYFKARAVILLLNAGADINIKDNFGRRAIDFIDRDVLLKTNPLLIFKLNPDPLTSKDIFDFVEVCTNSELDDAINMGISFKPDNENDAILLLKAAEKNPDSDILKTLEKFFPSP